MNKNIVLSALVILLGTAALSAQVVIKEEPEVRNLMNVYLSYNKAETAINAWRIQIVTTSDRRKMEAAVSKFRVLYPDIEYSCQHNSPYYQVKVGSYETRNDLEAILLEMKKEFPTAIPVQDKIEKTELIKP